jgi:hypothetical protein
MYNSFLCLNLYRVRVKFSVARYDAANEKRFMAFVPPANALKALEGCDRTP